MPQPKLIPVKEEKTGRDEMNLAEFALGLASDRNPQGVKTCPFGECTYSSRRRRPYAPGSIPKE